MGIVAHWHSRVVGQLPLRVASLPIRADHPIQRTPVVHLSPRDPAFAEVQICERGRRWWQGVSNHMNFRQFFNISIILSRFKNQIFIKSSGKICRHWAAGLPLSPGGCRIHIPVVRNNTHRRATPTLDCASGGRWSLFQRAPEFVLSSVSAVAGQVAGFSRLETAELDTYAGLQLSITKNINN